MPHAFTKDQLAEKPAIGLFAELGWIVAGHPSQCRRHRQAADFQQFLL
jgi:hypothetical protein